MKLKEIGPGNPWENHSSSHIFLIFAGGSDGSDARRESRSDGHGASPVRGRR